MFNALTSYLGAVKEELKKTSWPTREDTVKKTVLVIAISLAVALYIGVIDYLFNILLQKLLA